MLAWFKTHILYFERMYNISRVDGDCMHFWDGPFFSLEDAKHQLEIRRRNYRDYAFVIDTDFLVRLRRRRFDPIGRK